MFIDRQQIIASRVILAWSENVIRQGLGSNHMEHHIDKTKNRLCLEINIRPNSASSGSPPGPSGQQPNAWNSCQGGGVLTHKCKQHDRGGRNLWKEAL